MARLMDYYTGEFIREATEEEIAESKCRGAEGVFSLDTDGRIVREDEVWPDDRVVYVEEEKGEV